MTSPAPERALLALADLPEGRGRHVCRHGLDLALFRVGADVYAVEDSCPHAGASLSGGRVDGTTVKCPAHGLRFNLATAGSPPAALQPRSHPVCVRDGWVVLAADPAPDVPRGQPA